MFLYPEFKSRQKYTESSRVPYFKLAASYLPSNTDEIVVDVGPGDGSFIHSQGIYGRYKNIFLLDGNPDTVASLKKKFPEATCQEYLLPSRLPFSDSEISFIHLSHIIEHLTPQELYETLNECGRAIKIGGRLIISTPLMWDRFWDDLSHVRPYSPAVLRKYLMTGSANPTRRNIGSNFKEVDFTYRYRSLPLIESFTSKYFLLFLLIKLLNYILLKIGFRRYVKNGYTIVLERIS